MKYQNYANINEQLNDIDIFFLVERRVLATLRLDNTRQTKEPTNDTMWDRCFIKRNQHWST